VATVAKDGSAIVWDSTTGAQLAQLRGADKDGRGVVADSNGHLVTCTGQSVQVWGK